MPESKQCTMIADSEEATSDWIYIGAYPYKVVKGTSPLQAGVANAVYVWMRAFKVSYSCSCGGKTTEITIAGNLEYKAIKDAGNTYIVLTASVGLPIPGPLGTLGDVTGAGIDFAVWWALNEQASVDSKAAQNKPADDADSDKKVFQDPPVAVCGEKIKLGYGVEIPWPKVGNKPEIPMPPPPFIELECPSTELRKGTLVAMGSGTTKKGCVKDTIKKYAEKKEAAVKLASEILAGYRCKKPCPRIPSFQFKILPPKTPYTMPVGQGFEPLVDPDGKPLNNFAGFLPLSWELTISCGKGTAEKKLEDKSNGKPKEDSNNSNSEKSSDSVGEYKSVKSDTVIEPVHYGDALAEHIIAVQRARKTLIENAVEEAILSLGLNDGENVLTPWCEIVEEEPVLIDFVEPDETEDVRGAVMINWELFAGDDYPIELMNKSAIIGPFKLEIEDSEDADTKDKYPEV